MASKVKDAVVWYQKKVRHFYFFAFARLLGFCMSQNKKKNLEMSDAGIFSLKNSYSMNYIYC